MKAISKQKCAECAAMLQNHKSYRYISNSLGISVSMVAKIKDQMELAIPQNTGGHPRKLTASDRHYCVQLITSGKVDNACQLHRMVDFGVSKQTLCNALAEEGYVARVKVKKPLLQKHHYRQRLNFAKKYQFWTEDDWARVIFSDETKVNRMGSDGRVYVWGKKGSKCTK